MTDRDYADMVDPFVQAELAAYRRGYGEGIVTGIWYAVLAGIVAALLLFATKLHAADWTYEESPRVIKASERGARLTVCQQNAIERGWACFIVK